MSTLSDAELAQIRADIATLLPDTCNILSVTQTSDGMGGLTDTWGTASASVACRLDWKEGMEKVAGGALQPYSGWMLTVPHDTTITAQSRVEHGGNTYNVTGVDGDKSWKASVRVRLERV